VEPSIGPELEKLRERRRLSRQRLAQMIDSDPSTIWRLEKGERDPGLGLLWRLAQALDVRIVVESDRVRFETAEDSGDVTA
jgi:transcriptional regulator with XRE-family HTH domain